MYDIKDWVIAIFLIFIFANNRVWDRGEHFLTRFELSFPITPLRFLMMNSEHTDTTLLIGTKTSCPL